MQREGERERGKKTDVREREGMRRRDKGDRELVREWEEQIKVNGTHFLSV